MPSPYVAEPVISGAGVGDGDSPGDGDEDAVGDGETVMERMAETMAGHLGLRQMLMFATYGRNLVAVARQRNAPLVERLVQRAQAAGQLRADIRQTDIIFIVFVLIEATQLSHAANPDIWRRYLTLILDGMRPGRDGVTPLPVPAMLPEEMEKSMRQAAPWPR